VVLFRVRQPERLAFAVTPTVMMRGHSALELCLHLDQPALSASMESAATVAPA